MGTVTYQDFLDANLTDWQQVDGQLLARFLTGDFTTGLAFVNAVGEAAEEADHHPDVTLTYPAVEMRLISHDVNELTERDLDMARRISDIARERGIESD